MARGICLDTLNSAGGVLKSIKQTYVSAEGRRVIVVGDKVLPHPPPPFHTVPHVMVEGIPWITIDGIPVCFKNNLASCGHRANGTSWIFTN